MKIIKTKILVIGAGPAGCASASILKQHGHDDLIIVEKTKFPRFVIGESLLPHCMDILKEADLLADVQAQKFQNKTGALFFNQFTRKQVFQFADQFTNGWDHTFQVPRADFDLTLANTVQKNGIPIYFEHTVQSIQFESDAVKVQLTDEKQNPLRIDAQFIVDASGYGRVLPKLLQLDRPSSFPERQALFTHIKQDKRLSLEAEEKIWICIHPQNTQAWTWIIPFSNGKTSVGVVAEPAFFERGIQDSNKLLKQLFKEDEVVDSRTQEALFDFDAQVIRGYSASVSQFYGDRYVLLGNASEFLDPVFSSGVTIALECASVAAKLIHRHFKGESIDWKNEYENTVRLGVQTFKSFVERWYDGRLHRIIFSTQKNPTIQRQICSILAGYAWDKHNPFVNKNEKYLAELDYLCSIE